MHKYTGLVYKVSRWSLVNLLIVNGLSKLCLFAAWS